MKNVEKEINDELCSQGCLGEVKIVHGNVVFANKNVSTVYPKAIRVTTMYIDDKRHPLVELSVQ